MLGAREDRGKGGGEALKHSAESRRRSEALKALGRRPMGRIRVHARGRPRSRASEKKRIHWKRTKSFHDAQDAHSRVQPAGGDSRDVCSTAQMSAELRLHSEGCHESTRQVMVDETWAAKSHSKRSLEPYISVGPKEDPRTRDCKGCDVARSNGEHQGPREAQWNK